MVLMEQEGIEIPSVNSCLHDVSAVPFKVYTKGALEEKKMD